MTTTTAPSEAPLPVDPRPVLPTPVPALDVVVPVYNEEADLESCLRRLHAHLAAEFPYRFRITVADNASTDGTLAVAHRVAAELPGVDRGAPGREGPGPGAAGGVVGLGRAGAGVHGRGPVHRPGRAGCRWSRRCCPGTRTWPSAPGWPAAPGWCAGPKREVISRCYNLILRGTLAARFSDAQCGFKAIRADVARGLLPLVEDDGWFFDTELLVLAERSGLRIHEVPVDWVDDPDSRVDIVATALADLRGRGPGVAGAGHRAAAGRGAAGAARPGPAGPRYAGGAGRADPAAGPVRRHRGGQHAGLPAAVPAAPRRSLGAQPANLVALLLTAVANTAANRRLTFGVSGRAGAGRHQVQGLAVFGLGLALTSGSLALLHAASRRAAARGRARRAGRGQPGRDRAAVPAAAGLGVPGAGALAGAHQRDCR